MYVFDWDECKNLINQEKHGIDFAEASSVFYDERAILFDDPEQLRTKKGLYCWG